MEAVGVGYVFNLFDEGDLPGVDLRETGEYVRVDGSLYPLMKAATYEQSRMVDAALDIRGERRVDDFRWEEPRLPDGRGALAALLGGDDFYNPGAGIYLDSYLNELIVRRCSLDGFERLVGRMRDDGEDYRDGAVAPFEAAEKASDGDESIPLDEVGGLTRIASYAEKLAGDGWIPAGADLDSFVERAHEVEMGPCPLKVGLIDIGKEPRIVAVEADEDGSHLHGLQALVGGFIEPFTPLYGDEPCLYVNEDGIGEGLAPNRAIYASRRRATSPNSITAAWSRRGSSTPSCSVRSWRCPTTRWARPATSRRRSSTGCARTSGATTRRSAQSRRASRSAEGGSRNPGRSARRAGSTSTPRRWTPARSAREWPGATPTSTGSQQGRLCS